MSGSEEVRVQCDLGVWWELSQLPTDIHERLNGFKLAALCRMDGGKKGAV